MPCGTLELANLANVFLNINYEKDLIGLKVFFILQTGWRISV